MENEDLPPVYDVADDILPPVKQRKWALVDNGFVVAIKHGAHHLMHPFGDDAAGKIVLDVSGTTCAVGYVADHKGNVSPSFGRTEALMPHEPAYHDHSNPPAAPTATVPAALMGNEPHPLMKAGADQPDGKQDNRGTDTDMDHSDTSDTGDKAGEHPDAGLIQEHGMVQGEVKPDDQPG